MKSKVPKFKVGDKVRSYGFGEFVVENVYPQGDVFFYDLREVLPERLLKGTTQKLYTKVPEEYVYAL